MQNYHLYGFKHGLELRTGSGAHVLRIKDGKTPCVVRGYDGLLNALQATHCRLRCWLHKVAVTRGHARRYKHKNTPYRARQLYQGWDFFIFQGGDSDKNEKQTATRAK